LNSEVLLSKYSKEGQKLWQIHHANNANLNNMAEKMIAVEKMIVDRFGNVYLLMFNSFSIVKYNASGELDWSCRPEIRDLSPRAMEVGNNGDIYFADTGRLEDFYRIVKFSQSDNDSQASGESFAPVVNQLKTPISKEVKKQTTVKAAEPDLSLTKEERAYSKRMFEHLCRIYDKLGGKDIDDEFFSIPPEMFEMEMYKKWGLGDKKEFSRKEKYYLMQLPTIVQTWQMYSDIDTNNLQEPENSYLKIMRAKYGNKKINLRAETIKQQGSLEPHQEHWFDLIKATTGSDELSDRDLILVYRLTPK